MLQTNVADGVHRVTDAYTNWYLIEDGGRLTAVDAGLGGCFFGVPPERHDALRAALDIPAGRTPVGVVSVGYPAPDRRSPSLRRGRRPLAEVAHEGRFGVPYRA